jgi:hypothetical protein
MYRRGPKWMLSRRSPSPSLAHRPSDGSAGLGERSWGRVYTIHKMLEVVLSELSVLLESLSV